MKIKIGVKISSIVLILSLPITLLLTSVELNTFNLDFFESKFEQYDIMEKTKIDKSELLYIAGQLLDYLKDKRDNIIVYATIGNEIQQVFNEREVLHMIDVKKLFQKGFLLRNILFVISLLSLLFLLRFDKRKLKKALIISSIYPLVIMVVLIFLLYIDFNKYFTYFHLVFFDNDLWLLNPKTDVLIQMLPLEIFFSISMRIITYFFAMLILIILFCKLIIKEKRVY